MGVGWNNTKPNSGVDFTKFCDASPCSAAHEYRDALWQICQLTEVERYSLKLDADICVFFLAIARVPVCSGVDLLH
jgi:hypothetical protein